MSGLQTLIKHATAIKKIVEDCEADPTMVRAFEKAKPEDRDHTTLARMRRRLDEANAAVEGARQ